VPIHLRGFDLLKRLRDQASGSVLPLFAFAMFPLVGFVAAAVDYSRASSDRTSLQAALDAGALAGAKDGSAQWSTVATNVFQSAYTPKGGGPIPTPSFSSSNNRYTLSASTTTKSALLTPTGIQNIPISATAAAISVPGDSDTSCILTLGKGLATTASAMTFNGSPNVNLTGCTLRSNASMRCNGHNTNASGSVSVGTTTGCSNPQSGAGAVTDIYNATASNIVRKCSSYPGATWTPNAAPNSSKMITVFGANWTEYHVCGDLTLSGNGSLFGLLPNADSVIFVENGRLIMANSSAITVTRTAFVLTGDNSVASRVDFPNDNGHASSLTISPPTNSQNAWAGFSIYQDPALTLGVDANWGPGATLNADGIVYLPNSDLTLRGNSGSSASACAKLVINTLTVNGSVALTHTGAACTSLGVKQWASPAGSYMVQ
jgi:Flp pilus assembly protein TadG